MCHVPDFEKELATYSVSLERLPSFFQKFLFSTTSEVLKKCPYKFHSAYQNSAWTPINCFSKFDTFEKTWKNGPNTFVIVKTAFVSNVSIDFLGPKERFILLAQNISKYLVDPYKMFPDFFRVRLYERKTPKSFLHWKDCLYFSKYLCLQQPLRS